LGAGSLEFSGFATKLVGIIARRETGVSVAARTASPPSDDDKTNVADSIMVVHALIRRAFTPRPMLDDRPSSGKDQRALPAQQSVGRGHRPWRLFRPLTQWIASSAGEGCPSDGSRRHNRTVGIRAGSSQTRGKYSCCGSVEKRG
jgi:hypothetical protein